MQSRYRGSPETWCQVRETGGYQDEEAEEGGRHPTLHGWHYSFEDYGNNRHQGKADHIQLFTRREYSTKQKITYFSIYGYTDSIRFTFGIGMEYSSL